MKIVINRCFGGFALSGKAMKLYMSRKGLTEEVSNYKLERNDPVLVSVVEELGSLRASAAFSELKVVEIPDGIEWYIHDYDGVETIHEAHRSWC